MHETAHDVENNEAGGEYDAEDDETVLGEKNEFEEVANKWNSEGGDHDANNGKKKARAEFVEWARDPIDEDEVNSESNKYRDSGEFRVREALEVRNNREGGHTNGDSEADWEGVGENISGEAIFDAVGVAFKRENEAREADTGEVQEAHLDGGGGVVKGQKDEDDCKNTGVNGLGQKESSGAFKVVDRLAAFIDDGWNRFKFGIQEDQFGGAAGGVGTFTDGD